MVWWRIRKKKKEERNNAWRRLLLQVHAFMWYYPLKIGLMLIVPRIKAFAPGGFPFAVSLSSLENHVTGWAKTNSKKEIVPNGGTSLLLQHNSIPFKAFLLLGIPYIIVAKTETREPVKE